MSAILPWIALGLAIPITAFALSILVWSAQRHAEFDDDASFVQIVGPKKRDRSRNE